jgi:hypothetical protein
MTNGSGSASPSEHIVHVDLAGEARTDTQPQKLTANINVVLVGKAAELVSGLVHSDTGPTTETEHRLERAKQDIQTANDSARPAMQVAILINGGAATAILAYLSKGTQTPTGIIHAASWALAGYAVGVASAAAAMWWQTQALLNSRITTKLQLGLC